MKLLEISEWLFQTEKVDCPVWLQETEEHCFSSMEERVLSTRKMAQEPDGLRPGNVGACAQSCAFPSLTEHFSTEVNLNSTML